MKRPFVLLLILLLLLLGVQRTPEAQVGEGLFFIGGAVASGLAVGGCTHATGMTRPDTSVPPEEALSVH